MNVGYKAAIALCVLGLTYTGGIMHGKDAAKAKQNAAIVAYIPKVQAKQAETANNINEVQNETEAKIAELTVRNAAALAELGRLRIARPACVMPTGAASPSARNAPATDATNRPGSGEIDLDDVANEIVKLGADYDAANIRIDELISLVRVFEKACKVE